MHTPTGKTQRPLYLILLLVSIASIAARAATTSVATGSAAEVETQSWASPANGVVIDVTGHGDPGVNLAQGRLQAAYEGPDGLRQLLEQGLAMPTALHSADFDEDGTPDLICGYAGPGGGLVTLHRGNVESIFPIHSGSDTATAHQAKAANLPRPLGPPAPAPPFLFPARVFEIPEVPDFLGAGDFDNDGHLDILSAARGGQVVWLLPGDGRGELAAPHSVELPGTITALLTGEINRADGLADVIVGVVSADGPQVLVFESPEGALRNAECGTRNDELKIPSSSVHPSSFILHPSPEVFSLPAAATSLALGQLDGDSYADLAAAAGRQLIIVHGRDRKRSLDEDQQAQVQPADIDQFNLPLNLESVTAGDFIQDQNHRAELALLADDGSVHLLEQTATAATRRRDHEDWQMMYATEVVSPTSLDRPAAARLLVCANISSRPTDDLVVINPARWRLHVLSWSIPDGESSMVTSGSESPTKDDQPHVTTYLSIQTGGPPVAALAMRLNRDALDDLVILAADKPAPTVTLTAPLATFTVNLATDEADPNPFDGICDVFPLGVPGSQCTLRAAIQHANATLGADLIAFDIPGAGPHTISVSSPLPVITDPVTIDGTTQPGFFGDPVIELDGSNAGFNANGFDITAGNSVIRGMAINRFDQFDAQGVRLRMSGRNIIEGNYIGTDPNGFIARGNNEGVVVLNSSNNTIGGTTTAARNVISGNAFEGVEINGNSASGNCVQGNFIGLNADGFSGLDGATRGILIEEAPNNTIGGTSSGARNVISDNGWGIRINGFGATGNLVQGNYIGTSADGSSAIENKANGIWITIGSNTTVGGTTTRARNVISGNRAVGVDVCSSNGSLVQGNYIGTDASGSSALGNTTGVSVEFGSNNMIGGTSSGARNVISGNSFAGVFITSGTGAGHRVQGNVIGTDASGSSAIGNGNGVSITSSNNTIGGTSSGARNVISGNNGNGIEIGGAGDASGNVIQGNFIGTGSSGSSPLGNNTNGIFINSKDDNIIGGTGGSAGNVIAANGGSGVLISGNFGGGTGHRVQGNVIGGAGGMGNSLDGIGLFRASDNQIGGTTLSAANTITGNGRDGVRLEGGQATDNRVQGNIMRSNSEHGVALLSSASNNVIGGTMSGAANTITLNGQAGVFVQSGTGNAIAANSIFFNTLLGIDLNPSGVTFNDPGDGDAGANDLQNFPEVTSVTGSAGATTIEGKLNSTPNAAFRVEFFSNDTCDGFGEGETFIGSATVMTDGSGQAIFAVTFPVTLSSGQVITATATDADNNTSEFSACAEIVIIQTPIDRPGITTLFFRNDAGTATATQPGPAEQGLLIADFGRDRITVLLGNGDGTFESGQAIRAGDGPTAVAVGDFNDDGNTDAVVANQLSDDVTIMLGRGDGTFERQRRVGAGDGPTAVAAGDFTGDGFVDVVVTNFADNNVSLLRGRGDGSFERARNFPVDSNPTGIAVSDFNVDGRPDLAVSNFGSDNVTLLLGQDNGSFSRFGELPVGDGPMAVAVDDFNGDGRPDIATANFTEDRVSLLLSEQDGRFSAAGALVAGDGPVALVSGAFLSGRPGLALCNMNSGELWLYPNGEDGTLDVAQMYHVSLTPVSLTTGDYNGDDRPDIAVLDANGTTLQVLLDDGSGRYQLVP